MKRLPDNVHGAGVDSVYETVPFGSSVPNLDQQADWIAKCLEDGGSGNFLTAPVIGGVSVYKPINQGEKYCVRLNYYDARSLTDQEMADLETAIRATPDRDPGWQPPIE